MDILRTILLIIYFLSILFFVVKGLTILEIKTIKKDLFRVRVNKKIKVLDSIFYFENNVNKKRTVFISTFIIFISSILFWYLTTRSINSFIVITSIILASIPIFLQYRSYKLNSIKASYDLLELLKIYSQYTHLQLISALEKTQTGLHNNLLKQPINYIINSCRDYNDIDELEKQLSNFSKIINTTFASQFVDLILYANIYGNNEIKDSINNLILEMESQNKMIIEMRKESKDAIILGTYGSVLIFITLIITSIMFLGFDLYIKLQFTESGIKILLSILTTMFITFIITTFIKQPKLDY